ncbi:MAG: hypothetical protein NTX79_01775, partial [Candidatus Micrarchaeota archaeon]|nr:hypothetical protein [Candidatus Micrarchaeota archaeon]
MTSLRAQGATEYLVIAAVVLVIALVSVSLLGFFPSTAGSTNAEQSQTYWLSARPTGVYDAKTTESACGGSRGYTMTLENHEATPIKLTGVSIAGQSSTFCRSGQAAAGEIRLDSGEKATIDVPAAISSSASRSMNANISISYTSAYGLSRIQYGSIPIIITNSLPPLAILGESCATYSCASGLECDAGTCAAPMCAGDGESCDGVSCCSGLECDGGTCQAAQCGGAV